MHCSFSYICIQKIFFNDNIVRYAYISGKTTNYADRIPILWKRQMSIGDKQQIGRIVFYQENKISYTTASQNWWYPPIPSLFSEQPAWAGIICASENLHLDSSEMLECWFKVSQL